MASCLVQLHIGHDASYGFSIATLCLFDNYFGTGSSWYAVYSAWLVSSRLQRLLDILVVQWV